MRTDQSPSERFFARALAFLIFAVATLIGFTRGPLGALAGALLGGGLAAFTVDLLSRPAARRRAALAVPFPSAWRERLLVSFGHYRRLPSELRERFESDVRIFLAAKRISGVGTDVTDELRLLVAASAIALSLGWPFYDWDRLGEILLYPEDFDRDYGYDDNDVAGVAHPLGTVVLSVPSLRHSFADDSDAFHVGIHEFAHILDLEAQHFDGIPAEIDDRSIQAWETLAEREMRRLRRGRSLIDSYGAHSKVEFLAVAIEAFFEVPLSVREKHRELYDFLATYFGQDPAEWERALRSGS
jgi:Mlc titration factor MtfA (ptsG expression regulator)